MQPSTRSIEFTPEQVNFAELRAKFAEEQRAAFAERQCKMQAAIAWISSAATLEEQQHRGDRVWEETVERPRASRRIHAARRPRVTATIFPRARAREQRPAGTRRTSSSSRTSSTDPGEGDPEPAEGPWALWFVDRAPFLWRFRALRCRLLEIREGVDR